MTPRSFLFHSRFPSLPRTRAISLGSAGSRTHSQPPPYFFTRIHIHVVVCVFHLRICVGARHTHTTQPPHTRACLRHRPHTPKSTQLQQAAGSRQQQQQQQQTASRFSFPLTGRLCQRSKEEGQPLNDGVGRITQRRKEALQKMKKERDPKNTRTVPRSLRESLKIEF